MTSYLCFMRPLANNVAFMVYGLRIMVGKNIYKQIETDNE